MVKKELRLIQSTPKALRDTLVSYTGDVHANEFPDPRNSTTSVAGGPLDSVTTLMFECSEEPTRRPILVDRDDAYRMAAIASDFPPTVESFEE
jgi:hypothetical protein